MKIGDMVVREGMGTPRKLVEITGQTKTLWITETQERYRKDDGLRDTGGFKIRPPDGDERVMLWHKKMVDYITDNVKDLGTNDVQKLYEMMKGK